MLRKVFGKKDGEPLWNEIPETILITYKSIYSGTADSVK